MTPNSVCLNKGLHVPAHVKINRHWVLVTERAMKLDPLAIQRLRTEVPNNYRTVVR